MTTCPRCLSTDILRKSATGGECRECRARFTIQGRDSGSQTVNQSTKDGKRAMHKLNEQNTGFTSNKRSRYEDDSDTNPASNTHTPMLFSLSSRPNHGIGNNSRRLSHANGRMNDDDTLSQHNDKRHSVDQEDDLPESVMEEIRNEERSLLNQVSDEERDMLDDDDDDETEMLLSYFSKRPSTPSTSKRTSSQSAMKRHSYKADTMLDVDDEDMIDEDVSNLGINDSRTPRSDVSSMRTLRDTRYNIPTGSTAVSDNEDLYTWDLPMKKHRHGRMKKQLLSSSQQQRQRRPHYDDDSASDFQPEGYDDEDDISDTDEENVPQKRHAASRFSRNNQPTAFKRRLAYDPTELDDTEDDDIPPMKEIQRMRKKRMDAQPKKKPKPMTPDTVSVNVVDKTKRGKTKGKEKALQPKPMFSDEEDYIASDYEQSSFSYEESRQQSQTSSQAPSQSVDMHIRSSPYNVPRPGNKFNPYFLFNAAMRKKIIETDALSNKEVSQKVSQMWRELSKEEKQKYIDESNRLKDEYNRTHGRPDRNLKWPPNSFVIFSREMHPKIKKEHPDYKFSDINALVSQKWKELDEESKNVYKERSLEARQKFMEEHPEQYKAFVEKNSKKANLAKMNNKKRMMEILDWYNKHH